MTGTAPTARRAAAPRRCHARRHTWLALATGLFALCHALAASPYDIEASVPARVVGARYFASHLHRLVPDAVPNAQATPWPAGQIGALRLWDSTTRWADLEPAPGAFRFERLDTYVATARAHGASLLMVLGSPPRWASARPDEAGPYGPGSAAEPRNLEDWERYVTALARRYKGRIAQYELWNEPYFSDLPADRGHASAFFTGSVATMVELARRTRAVLDREDPQALLLTPGFVGAPHRIELFLGAGGGQHVDAVAYHYYTDSEADFIQLHRDIRAVLARHGLAHLTLTNTENGFAARDDNTLPSGGDTLPDRHTAAALLARSLLLGAFLGIERYHQYAWDNGRSGMLLPGSLEPTPSLAAFAAVRRWLMGTRLKACRGEPGGLVRCEGERNGKQLLVAWRPSAGPASTLRLPPGARPVFAEYAVARGQAIDLKALRETGIAVGGDPVAVWWRPASTSEATRP